MTGNSLRSLPPLPLEGWRATKDTLHLYLQILGKVRLASTPVRNHWWNVPFHVSARGLTLNHMSYDGVDFDIQVDLVDHQVVLRTPTGIRTIPLRDGLSVAEFYRLTMAELGELGLHPEIIAKPFGVPMTTPFAEDTEHASYDSARVERFFEVLRFANATMTEFSGWFCGKASPVHLFWHSFDLAYTRFSGRRVTDLGAVDPVTAEAYSHEVVSFGFWAGDDKNPFPAFYSYTAPQPAGLAAEPIGPAGAKWTDSMALYTYEDCRNATDPQAALLEFLQTTYVAGAKTAGWDQAEFTSSTCPDHARPN